MKKPKHWRDRDPHHERESDRYAEPIPSREMLLEELHAARRPLDAEALARRLQIKKGPLKSALAKRLAAMTRDGWTFASGPTRTTAEVIDELYRTIRTGAGDSLVIGCNTVSHLSAGHFEICRVGDDTSGRDWSRTRKMGVNTLAFRGTQHGAFYVADADCVGVTNAVPWVYNRQWLDLLARSGTMLFVSLAPDALGAAQRRDLKEALALAATAHPLAEPLDWQSTVYPARWRLMDRERKYDWVGVDGAGAP